MPGNEPAECRRPRVSSGALGDIVFGNPFSAERARGIVRLVPGVPLGDLDSNREALARVVEPRGYCSEVRSKTGGGWSSPSSTCATTAAP